jgi:hypothetical protein
MQSAENYLRIELSPQNLQQFCAVLNEFALPRAIVDFERHAFVAWNSKFLELTGFSEEEIKSSGVEELLAFGESWFPLSTEGVGQRVEYIACTAQRRIGADPAHGVAVRAHDKIGYIMLDVFDKSSGQFEQGRNAGREEERNRIVSTFHEEVSSSIIAALFLIETAKSELQDAGLPQAEMVSKASEILTQTTEKIADVLGPSEQNAG